MRKRRELYRLKGESSKESITLMNICEVVNIQQKLQETRKHKDKQTKTQKQQETLSLPMIIDKNVRKETKDIITIFRKANLLTYFYEVRISSDSLSNIVSRKVHYVKNIDR